MQKAGSSVCSGGMIGLGEENHDRIGLLHSLITLQNHPESIPINVLIPVDGTPIGDKMKVVTTRLNTLSLINLKLSIMCRKRESQFVAEGLSVLGRRIMIELGCCTV